MIDISKLIYQKHTTQLDNKYDHIEVRNIKTLVRRVEARSAAKSLGVNYDNIYHLDLPFYESGTTKKKPISQEDYDIVKFLITKIKPDIMFAAGDLTDPHGTHRICLQAILESIS